MVPGRVGTTQDWLRQFKELPRGWVPWIVVQTSPQRFFTGINKGQAGLARIESPGQGTGR